MPQILRTASALQDLDEIWDYIAIENHQPDAADRLIEEIDAAVQMLATHPQMGEPVEHLRHNTRRFRKGLVMGAYAILMLIEISFFGYVFFAKSLNRPAINIAGFISAIVGSWAFCMWAGENDTAFLRLAYPMAFNVLVLVLIRLMYFKDGNEPAL